MSLTVTILQLETLQAVVDTGSTVEAAQKLYTSQSSVSKTLARLEANLGFPLFDHQHGTLALTEPGKMFYQAADQMLKDLNRSIRASYGLYQKNKQTLNVSGSTYLLRNLSQQYLLDNMAGLMNIQFYPEKNLLELLSTQETDLAVSTEQFRYPSNLFQWVPLMTCSLLIALSVKHPLATSKYLTLAGIQNEQIVCNNVGISGDFVRSLFERNKIASPSILECNEHTMFSELMSNTRRIAIIPSYAILETMVPDTLEIPLKGANAEQNFGIVYRKDSQLTAEQELFISLSVQYCKELAAQTRDKMARKGISAPTADEG